MPDYMKWECEYCGRMRGYPSQLEERNGKLVCKDIESCDAADAARDQEERAD